jgi:alkylation response protein AidB-like acyl-CoA dehydrogenase
MTGAADEDRAVLTALTASAASFAQRRLAPGLGSLGETDAVGRDVVADLAGAGLWRLGVPESAGGQGADLGATVAVVFELARVSPSVAVAVVHAHAAAHALLAAGGGADGAAAGAAGGAVADAAGRTASVADEVVITGFTGGRSAVRLDLGLGPDQILIVDAAAGRTCLLAADAIAAGPAEPRCGLAGLGTRLVEFDRVALAERAWTGEAHERARRAAIRWWSAGVAMCALGAADAAVERAASYAGTRVQFGSTLTAIPTVARSLEEARLAVRGAAQAVLSQCADSGDWPAGLARRSANIAVRVCLDSLQLFGGYGYLTEYPVESLLRDTVSLRAAAQTVSVA